MYEIFANVYFQANIPDSAVFVGRTGQQPLLHRLCRYDSSGKFPMEIPVVTLDADWQSSAPATQ